MKKPSGKLAFAYATIANLEEKIARLEAVQPAPVAVITYQQVFKAYEYAESHPHKYLRGTTNWCAAVAYALNAQQPLTAVKGDPGA